MSQSAKPAAGPPADSWKDWLPERIATDLEDVHILHFSGEVKMWDRFLEGSTESNAEFV